MSEQVRSKIYRVVDCVKNRKVLVNPMYRTWYGLPEPKIISLLQTMIYVLVFLYGVFQLFSGGHHEEHVLPWVWYTVSTTFVVGGIISLASAPKRYWQFERGGLILILTGFVIHFGWTIVDPSPGLDVGQAFRIAVCILALVMRYSSIAWARMDPKK